MDKMHISPSNSENESISMGESEEKIQNGYENDFDQEFKKAYKKVFHAELHEKNKTNIVDNTLARNQYFIPVNEVDLFVKKEPTNIFNIYSKEDFSIFHPSNKIEYYEKYYNEKGIFGLWKDKKNRREMPDDIRKKIKSRFFKALKININNILGNSKNTKKSEFLPQDFISNISKKENQLMLDDTLKNLILKYNAEYLNNITKTDINNILNKKIKELFSEYLKSKEFEESINNLKEEGNYFEYIKDYITYAKDFINYFSC